MAGEYAKFLRSHPESLNDFLYTMRQRRTRHEHRAVLLASSSEELVQRLEDLAVGNRQEWMTIDRALPGRNRDVAFLFCGQGPQWYAMGRELLQEDASFAATIRECDGWLKSFGSQWSIEEEIQSEESQSRMGDTAIAQPAICALQIGLARLWISRGIVPKAVMGHSVGEIAAAHVAGVLSLEDAMRVIYQRGRCMSLASKSGGMLAVSMTVEESLQRLEKYDGQIGIAAMNGPQSQTISGEKSQLELLSQELERDRIFCKFLRVNQAFHSFHMDSVQPDILRSLEGIQPRQAKMPIVSTVTGEWATGEQFTAEYWWDNIRQPVRFAEGTRKLLDSGLELFVELGPHPVLDSAVTESALASNKTVKIVPSLRRKEPEQGTLLRSFGHLFCLGVPTDWSRIVDDQGRFVRLPTYPWQKEVYWHEAEESKENRLGMLGRHPLLGRSLKQSLPHWQSHLSLNHLPYLVDHQVQGHVLVPATAMFEMVLAAGKEMFGTGPYVLEDVRLAKAIFLNPGTERIVQTSYDPLNAGFQVRTGIAEPNCNWTLHCSGHLRSRQEEAPIARGCLNAIRDRCHEKMEQEDCYELFKKQELSYGPQFRGIRRLWRGKAEAFGEIQATEEVSGAIADYQFHPALLDACLQCAFGAMPLDQQGESGSGVFLPVEVEQIRVYGPASAELFAHARLQQMDAQGITIQLQVYDAQGTLLVDIQGLRCQHVGMNGEQAETSDDLLYSFQWKLSPLQKSAQQAGLTSRKRLDEMFQSLDELALSRRNEAVQSVRTRLVRGLDRLAIFYVLNAFKRLGVTLHAQACFHEEEMRQRLRVASQHKRIFRRYLKILAEEGILAEENGMWQVLKTPEEQSTTSIWQELLHESPAFYAELTMIRRCGEQLDKVLCGEINPLQLIFPEGSLDTAEHLYQDSPSVRLYNTLARQAIVKLIEGTPEDRVIRILEIGAGTGGLTSHVLPFLPSDRTQYVFTDLSNHFFNKGKQKFSDYPFLDYQLLDIEKSPLEQGFSPHSFDVVIASQVLHATKDLSQTLQHVHQLLSPQGALVMLELLKPARWIDLVFGLTEGWWHFTDLHLRTDYPLLSFDKWEALLRARGFDETVNIAQGQEVEGFGSAVIVSRKSTEPSDSLHIPTSHLLVHMEGDDGTTGHEGKPIATEATHQGLDGEWLMFVDRQGLGESLANELEKQGGKVTRVYAGEAFAKNAPDSYVVSPRSAQDFIDLLNDLLSRPALRVLHLWNLDQPGNEGLTASQLREAHDLGCLSVMHLYQAWGKTLRSNSAIHVFTRFAQSVRSEAPLEEISLAQTNVWGICRVLFNEYSKLRLRIMDLGEPCPKEVESILAELRSNAEEDEIALRGDARYVNRFLRRPLLDRAPLLSKEHQETAYRLESTARGVLDGLSFREQHRKKPDGKFVEIEVHASALNFSDVMKALGLYPGLPDGPVPLGIECAGRVSAVGPEVTEWKVGDDVCALAEFSFGSHAVTHEALIAKMPGHLTYDEAATLPIAFLTAQYALVEVGRLQAGEKVLIHSAAGGVGLAAIQVAKKIGAEIFVTAGSTEKREFLASLGVDHVMNSRSLRFVDEIMEMTQGQGVDVVLNSLSGEAITKSLTVLNDFGRFLEIGKRDIYMNSPLGMRGFKKNVAFIAIDLDRVMRQRPKMVGTLFRQVINEVGSQHYQALPHRVFTATNIRSAFRYMAQAKHMGKVVVTFEDAPVRVVPIPPKPVRLREDASYLITGGLGGFGLLVAKWMAEQGAKHFILMGRRGIHSAEAQAGVDALRQLGAKVLVVQGDVSKQEDVQRAFDVASEMPEVRGVLHAAMHLEDCLLNQLDRDAMLRVVEPKMIGGWNLHRQTESMPLDFSLLSRRWDRSLECLARQTMQRVISFGFVAVLSAIERNAWAHHQLGLPARGWICCGARGSGRKV